jgi:polyphenol oxidase
MITHATSSFVIAFGEGSEQFFTQELKLRLPGQALYEQEPFKTAIKNFALHDLIFLEQVHGTDGFVFHKNRDFLSVPSFSCQGDFLISERPGVGIAIATADCLPIIFYDQRSHVIAIAHAGWRGTVAKIAQKTMQKMIDLYKSRPEDLQIFFGPSAKKCCYAVGPEVVAALSSCSYGPATLSSCQEKLFFDLPRYNQLQLEELGISISSINVEYNSCTICNLNFCSYRRQQENAGRQMTIALLR